MSLLSSLRVIANRLHIIQSVDDDDAATETVSKIPTRSLTLAELMSEIRQDEVRALANAPAELTVGLEKVCEAAGVKPGPDKWTVDRLGDLLHGEKFASLSRDAAQRALLAQFSAEKVSIEELVKDAVARDQAIDAFEQFVRDKMHARSSARESRIGALQAQMADLQQEVARLTREGETETKQWQQWRQKKQAYEKEMAWAVSYLLDKPVITTE